MKFGKNVPYNRSFFTPCPERKIFFRSLFPWFEISIPGGRLLSFRRCYPGDKIPIFYGECRQHETHIQQAPPVPAPNSMHVPRKSPPRAIFNIAINHDGVAMPRIGGNVSLRGERSWNLICTRKKIKVPGGHVGMAWAVQVAGKRRNR